MKRLALVLGLILASPSYAINVYIPAGACVVGGSTATRVSHERNVANRGGSHIDIRLATNNAGGATNLELGFCDFPYPPDLADGSTVTVTYVLESNETTNGLNHCINSQMCSSIDGTDFASCNTVLSNTQAKQVYTTSSDGSYIRERIISPTNPVNIFKTGTFTACTQATCADNWVRLMFWRDDSIPGCSAPSSNVFAIRGASIH